MNLFPRLLPQIWLAPHGHKAWWVCQGDRVDLSLAPTQCLDPGGVFANETFLSGSLPHPGRKSTFPSQTHPSSCPLWVLPPQGLPVLTPDTILSASLCCSVVPADRVWLGSLSPSSGLVQGAGSQHRPQTPVLRGLQSINKHVPAGYLLVKGKLRSTKMVFTFVKVCPSPKKGKNVKHM